MVLACPFGTAGGAGEGTPRSRNRNYRDLLRLEPEQLAGALFEVLIGVDSHDRQFLNRQNANQDAIATAAAIGIDPESAITYRPNRGATAKAVTAMSAAVGRSRKSRQSVSYTPGERKASLADESLRSSHGRAAARAGLVHN